MTKTDFINIVIDRLEKRKDRSAWDRGVTTYALDIFESRCYELDEFTFAFELVGPETARKFFLNGALDWCEYSNGGCSLIYNADIARRLCTPSELKRTDDGRLNPNKRETWLDVQSRALIQAYTRLYDIISDLLY